MECCFKCGCFKPKSVEIELSAIHLTKPYLNLVCKSCDTYQMVCPTCQMLTLCCPECNGPLIKGKNNLDLLNEALREKDEEAALRVVYELGFKINNVGSRGIGVLHIAAMAGNAKVIDTAINLGADVHIKDKNGRTALVNAVWARNGNFNLKIIKFFKDAINDADLAGRTAIFYAVKGAGSFGSRKGSVKIAKELIANGAKLDVRDNSGLTALDHAIQEYESSKTGQNADVVEFLKEMTCGDH